jgi:hypothetical protein
VVWDTKLVPNGVYTIRAEAADSKGAFNRTDLTNIEVYNPPSPILTPIFPKDNDTITGIKELTVRVVSFTNLSTLGVSFYISDDNSSWTLIGNTSIPKVLDDYNITFDSMQFDDGVYYFMMNVTDVAGQTGNLTISNVTIVNDYAPVLEFVYPLGGEVLSGDVTIRVNVTDADDDLNLISEGISVFYRRLTEGWTKIGTINQSDAVGGSIYSIQLNTTTMDNGDDYGFWGKVEDLTGLITNTYTPDNISIYNIFPPTIELLPPEEPLRAIVTLTANVTDFDRNINTTRGVQFAYSKDKTDWTYIGKQTSPKDPKANELLYEFTWNVGDIENGMYWLKANVSDYHDLYAEDVLLEQIQIDNIHLPVIEIKKPEEGEGISGIYTIEIFAFDKDDDINSSGVQLFYAKPSGSPNWKVIGNTLSHNETFIYTFDWDTTVVDNGNYVLRARVTDLLDQSAEHEMELPFTLENSVDADSDGDGLPDVWERTYFPDLDQSGSGDYDNDGHTNLEEYNAGTDPTDPDDHPADGDDEEGGFMKFMKDNIMWLVIALVVLIILIIVVILILVMTKKKRAERREKKAEDKAKLQALDQLHESMDKMVEDLSKMKTEPGSYDTEYIAPSKEFFADSTPIYETDQWGAAGEVDVPSEEFYAEEAPIYAMEEEEEEDYGVEEEEEEEEEEEDFGVPDEEEMDEDDILSLDEDDVEIDEDEVEIEISEEELDVEDVEDDAPKSKEKKPSKPKREKPPKKREGKKKPGKKKVLDEVDEEDIDIDDSINLKVR